MRVLGFVCGAWAATSALASTVLQDGDEEAEAGGIKIKFSGKGGKFKIYSKDKEDKTKIEIEVEKVSEVDAEGNEIKEHTVNSVASQDFDFTVNSSAELEGIEAHLIKFQTDLEKSGNKFGAITVDTYLMKGEGEVGPNMSDPESVRWSVGAGSLKFAIELEDWDWDPSGMYVDVELEVKTKSKAKKGKGGKGKGGKGRDKDYDLGGDSIIELTADVDIDGEYAEMPEDYPKYKEKGNKEYFIFRFPKFNERAKYDPVIEVDVNSDESGAQRFLAAFALALPLLGFSLA